MHELTRRSLLLARSERGSAHTCSVKCRRTLQSRSVTPTLGFAPRCTAECGNRAIIPSSTEGRKQQHIPRPRTIRRRPSGDAPGDPAAMEMSDTMCTAASPAARARHDVSRNSSCPARCANIASSSPSSSARRALAGAKLRARTVRCYCRTAAHKHTVRTLTRGARGDCARWRPRRLRPHPRQCV